MGAARALGRAGPRARRRGARLSAAFTVHAGARLAGERSGEGTPVVLLHGLTATRRYVVMGSRALERSGHLVISYDARGHGQSGPAADYSYASLAADLEAVLDSNRVERALLAGASMGAHTAARFALEHPERVAGLVLITPAYDPAGFGSAAELQRWDRLARGLREDGVEGFLSAYPLDAVSERLRPTVERVIRQRLGAHLRPEAVADALEAVPRSRPFESLDELSAVEAPTRVVASRDEPDPGHPLAVGEAWARAIVGAELVVEEPSSSPIAWQGGRLSKLIADLAART